MNNPRFYTIHVIACYILLTAVFFLNFSCSTPSVWGLSPREFKSRLLEGNLSHLVEPDISSREPAELLNLGPGGAFFVSFYEFADPEIALRLRVAEAVNGEEPYAFASACSAAGEFLRNGEYRRVLRLNENLEGRYREFYQWRRLVLEALYWEREDNRGYAALKELRTDFPGETSPDTELLLFEAVLAQRISDSADTAWAVSFVELFRSVPAGSLHIRAHDYLRLQGLLDNFSDDERQLLYAVDQTARYNGTEAWPLLYDLAKRRLFISPAVIQSLSAAVTTRITREQTAEFLLELAEESPGLGEKALEAAARLYRSAGLHGKAGELYARLPESERNRWYIFSSAVKSNPLAAVEALPRLVMSMEDYAYYDDVLFELAGSLSSRKEWSSLLRAYRYLDGNVGAAVLGRYAYISARVRMERIEESEVTDLPPRVILGKIARGEYPGAAIFSGPAGNVYEYYRILASVLTGTEFSPLPPRENPAVEEAGGSDSLVRGFLEYGLQDKALEYSAGADVSLSAVLEAVRATSDGELASESLRILLKNFDLSDAGIPAALFYPRPFNGEISRAAEEYSLPQWLLYSLIRRESLFNVGAVSRAGAIGLMQLMPETAADVAARLHLNEYNLSLTEDNLRFGSWYLRNMIDRTDNLSDAAASYNAGINRMRSWRSENRELPDDLFIESIPYTETRAYVKALLVSSIYYGYLYQHQTADQIVGAYMPDLIQ